MKKVIVAIVLIATGIFVLWIAARFTHAFETYHMGSTVNEPTYQPGSIVMASRFKKPDYNAFVCFKRPNNMVWVSRCIAKEGDIIEIKDAKVYLNGKLLNEPYTYNEYYITDKQLNSIAGYVEQYKYPVRTLNDSLHVITMTEKEKQDYHLNLKPFIVTKSVPNQDIFAYFKKLNYNEDNLGPVKVPKDSYFLLGDDRHNAWDSRFLGFVSKDDIVSTVIN